MAPVTAERLAALLGECTRVKGSDEPPPTDSVPPGYSHRRGWRPRTHGDFGEGGAFPEIHLVQMPEGLGWDSKRFPDVTPIPVLDCSFAELQTKAARSALRLTGDEPGRGAPRRATPEYDALMAFLRTVRGTRALLSTETGDGDDESDVFVDAIVRAFLDAHPNAREARRVTNVDPSSVAREFLGAGTSGAGEPAVVADGGRDWTDSAAWTTLDGLRNGPLRDRPARCNDRAPARHADAAEDPRRVPGADVHGTKQRTCELPFREFLEYVERRPRFLNATGRGGAEALEDAARADAPFYCNGWRAFESHHEKDGGADVEGVEDKTNDARVETAAEAFPRPYFTRACDATRVIASEARRALLEKLLPGRDHARAARTAADALDASLCKLFVGPAGTITRLHQDAGDAHGWLGQVTGRKLFLLCPPGDAPFMRSIPGEKETTQSFVDPFDFSSEARRTNAAFWERASPVVLVLRPGEVVLVPRGWWHYAAALDPSVTAMKNFYDAETNLEALARVAARVRR